MVECGFNFCSVKLCVIITEAICLAEPYPEPEHDFLISVPTQPEPSGPNIADLPLIMKFNNRLQTATTVICQLGLLAYAFPMPMEM